MTATPAGWHPAPDRPGQLRYWDGEKWTDHYAPGVPPVAPGKKSRVGLWVTLGFVGALLVGCAAMVAVADDDTTKDTARDSGSGSTDGKPDPNDPDEVGDEVGAIVVCQDFVKRQLKSPSSADFSDEEGEQVKGATWLVTGAVDSENSFGASIRNNYACKVRFTGDDHWRLVELTGLTN